MGICQVKRYKLKKDLDKRQSKLYTGVI